MNRLGTFDCRPGLLRSLALAWVAFAAPGVPAAPAAAHEVVDIATIRAATTNAAALTQARRLDELADRQATDELAAALAHLASAPTGSLITHEWLLDRGLHALARMQPTAAAAELVQQLSLASPHVFIRVDPDHGQHAIPLYDPGATARFVARVWERRAARERATQALAADNRWPIERFTQDALAAERDPTKAGIADAFHEASAETLARQRSALLAAIRGGARVDELAAITAFRLRDAELYGLVLHHAQASVALDALKRTCDALGDAGALTALIDASGRPEIASAAMLEIGRLAGRDARARDHLFESLGDASNGASAAAALASLHAPEIVVELGRRLRANTPEASRRHLALALKLEGSSASRGELDQFLAARTGSAKLREDVRTWLEK